MARATADNERVFKLLKDGQYHLIDEIQKVSDVKRRTLRQRLATLERRGIIESRITLQDARKRIYQYSQYLQEPPFFRRPLDYS